MTMTPEQATADAVSSPKPMTELLAVASTIIAKFSEHHPTLAVSLSHLNGKPSINFGVSQAVPKSTFEQSNAFIHDLALALDTPVDNRPDFHIASVSHHNWNDTGIWVSGQAVVRHEVNGGGS
ncbi:hypothetical protein ACFOVU_18635 [Nocardiopsis sediminis]|uniref:Uncharacterized protein n=1 Tax=Nocardiopsis sediminis TaxID=1778267 RepID=A0ABV8FRS7_9ACTN